MTERQSVLEEHNRLLEIEMQKLRLLIQQVHDEARLKRGWMAKSSYTTKLDRG